MLCRASASIISVFASGSVPDGGVSHAACVKRTADARAKCALCELLEEFLSARNKLPVALAKNCVQSSG